MRQHKVAHITTIPGGMRSLLLDQLCSIKEAGYDVVGISAPGTDPSNVPAIEAAGIRHIAVPMIRDFSPHADLLALWRLFRVMRREAFTVVHTHNPKPGLLGQVAARMARVPIVVNTVHGFFFHDNMPQRSRRFHITLEKIAARCSDVILSQNREDMEVAIREGICPPEKIKHLGNGIDLTRFDPACFSAADIMRCRQELGIPDGAPVVGFVGRLVAKRKGFLDFLAAARAISEQLPNARFLIIGEPDGGSPDAVNPAVAADYGIMDRCLFLGRRLYHELPLFYTAMDVLVLPSLFEGVPRVVMEASAMQVPAVVTDVRGNREAVEHGRNGLMVPLGDVDALSRALLDLLGDLAATRRMGEAGRRMALECFDERLVFEKVRAEYAHLIHAKGLGAITAPGSG